MEMPAKGHEHAEDTRMTDITNAAYFSDDYVANHYHLLPKYEGTDVVELVRT